MQIQLVAIGVAFGPVERAGAERRGVDQHGWSQRTIRLCARGWIVQERPLVRAWPIALAVAEALDDERMITLPTALKRPSASIAESQTQRSSPGAQTRMQASPGNVSAPLGRRRAGVATNPPGV